MHTTTLVRPSRAKVLRPPLKTPRPSTTDAQGRSHQLESLMRLMTLETGKAIQFEIAAHPDSKVYIAGSFNNWDPTTHPLHHHPEDGVFKATLLLPAGTHEYKFVVNGVWHCDEKCPHRVPNAHGSHNSVVHI